MPVVAHGDYRRSSQSLNRLSTVAEYDRFPTYQTNIPSRHWYSFAGFGNETILWSVVNLLRCAPPTQAAPDTGSRTLSQHPRK